MGIIVSAEAKRSKQIEKEMNEFKEKQRTVIKLLLLGKKRK